jgi:hypothetical protein
LLLPLLRPYHHPVHQLGRPHHFRCSGSWVGCTRGAAAGAAQCAGSGIHWLATAAAPSAEAAAAAALHQPVCCCWLLLSWRTGTVANGAASQRVPAEQLWVRAGGRGAGAPQSPATTGPRGCTPTMPCSRSCYLVPSQCCRQPQSGVPDCHVRLKTANPRLTSASGHSTPHARGSLCNEGQRLTTQLPTWRADVRCHIVDGGPSRPSTPPLCR